MTTDRKMVVQPDTAQRTVQMGDDYSLMPREVVRRATEQAVVLMEIVEKQKLYQLTRGKKFLQVEAWQTIGRFNRASALVEWTRPVIEHEKVIGYHARTQILRDGEVESAAEAFCFLDESVCMGRNTESGKRQAAISMAQTRSTSKAFRLAYSFVAVLAGFQPTTAEEMLDDDNTDPVARPPQRPQQSQGRNGAPQQQRPAPRVVDVTPEPAAPTPEPTEEERQTEAEMSAMLDDSLKEFLDKHGTTPETFDTWLVRNYGSAWANMSVGLRQSALMAAQAAKERQQASGAGQAEKAGA